MKKLLVLLICVTIFFPACTKKNQTGIYPAAIMINNKLYYVSGEKITKDYIGKELSKVKTNIDGMPQKNSESNYYKKGTSVFEVKDSKLEEVIACEMDGEYRLCKPQ